MPITNSISTSDNEISQLREEIKALKSQILSMTVKNNKYLSEHLTLLSVKFDVPFMSIYDTIHLKDDNTTLDGVDYKDETYQTGIQFDLTAIRTRRLVYTHTGSIGNTFLVKRYSQMVASGGNVTNILSADNFNLRGTYIFECVHLRSNSSGLYPPNPHPTYNSFELTAFFPLVTDS